MLIKEVNLNLFSEVPEKNVLFANCMGKLIRQNCLFKLFKTNNGINKICINSGLNN